MERSEKSKGYAKLSIHSLGDTIRPLKPRSKCKLKSTFSRSKHEVTVVQGPGHQFTHFDNSAAPVDSCSRVYVAFILSGIGYMLPYSCFIVAVDYYQNRFPHTTVIFDMTAATILAGTGGVIINSVLVESVSLTWRVLIGYIISTFLLLFLTVCDVTLAVFARDTAYWVTLVSVAVMSVGCSVQQSSFYGYANMLPRRYTQAVMVGESFAGVVVSINRIITKLLLKDEGINTIIFFVISIFVNGVCCLTFYLAKRSRFVRYYLNSCRTDKTRIEPGNGTEFVLKQGQYPCFEFEVAPKTETPSNMSMQTTGPTSDASAVKTSDVRESDVHDAVMAPASEKPTETTAVPVQGRNSVVYGSARGKEEDITSSRTSLVMAGQSRFRARLRVRLEVAKQIWLYMASFGLTFYVSVSLYPGIISEVVSCKLGSWMPVILMACFNFTDAFGKSLTSIRQNYTKLRLLLCSLTRICLIPLAIMCCKPRFRPMLSGEAWSIIVTVILGATNGYFGSLPLVLAPSHVAPRHRELCGNTMMISFTVAIICGVFTSYGLDLLIGPHPDLEICNINNKNSNFTLIPTTTATHGLTVP